SHSLPSHAPPPMSRLTQISSASLLSLLWIAHGGLSAVVLAQTTNPNPSPIATPLPPTIPTVSPNPIKPITTPLPPTIVPGRSNVNTGNGSTIPLSNSNFNNLTPNGINSQLNNPPSNSAINSNPNPTLNKLPNTTPNTIPSVIPSAIPGVIPGAVPTTSTPRPDRNWAVPDRGIPQPNRPARYTLAPGDRINVVIYNVPEFTGAYQLMVDGSIMLPVIGAVDVEGMTESEAAVTISKLYADAQVLVKPVIMVLLSEMSNVHVAILGEVTRPGAYVVTPKNGELPTLTQIIDEAGGITQQTNLQQIEIRRPLRDGTAEIINSSLWDLLTNGDLSQDIAIRDGDTVILHTATEMTPEVALQVGRSNVSPGEIKVNLLGEVLAPGVQTIPTGTSLNEAIMLAGGFGPRAKKKTVELLRLNANGTVSRRKIAINLDKPINSDSNPILQSRDVILVDRSLGAKITDTIGNILTPINSIFSVFGVFRQFPGK
ncbi:SLBB domain-containing protein, partial [Alkalinema pantanalense CENA528]|uniref:SLBB domain-containing protein n=1 Tax=Alkalinema pantanalense TaxID=1620705 RepID=UPI003D6DBB37